MNHTKNHVTTGEPGAEEASMGLVDFLTVLARRKKLIIWLPLLTGLIVAAISFALSPVYRASATLLPPQQGQSTAAALLSQLGGAGGLMAGAAGIKNPNDLYVGMLKSRTIADNLVTKFSLLEVYETESFEKARTQLQGVTSIGAAKSGLITVAVEDTDKVRAAKITNAYIDELVQLTKVLAVTEASQRRLFYEQQLELAKDKLAAAELQLKRALDTHGVISVDSDSRAAVATVARLRAQISSKEIQLSAMKAFVTSNNHEFKRVQEEIISLRTELNRLENGRPSAGGTIRESPQGLQNIKTLRDVKYHQMLYELLAKQYEMARLDEAANSSVIQVLDKAIAPEQKFKPKRTALVLMSTVIAFLFAVALAYALEAIRRWRSTSADDEKWAALRRHLQFRA